MDPDPGGPKHVDPVNPDSDPQHWFFQWKKAGGILGTGPVCVTSYAGINGIGRKKIIL
jgi:hypothetical protein